MKKSLLALLLGVGMLAPSLAPVSADVLQPGALIKGSGPAVYWYATPVLGGRRHVFPDLKTFYTWFSPFDFGRINTISDAELAAIPIGHNITYRPGTRLIKISTDPKVYLPESGNTIRWIQSEAVAAAMFGPQWQQYVDEVPDAFFVNYVIGTPITRAASDYAPVVNLTPEDNIRNFR